MVDKKVTTMELKVDLECDRCYKKVKKVLCGFPEIQDQVYNETKNTVTIKVVCCSPEKIKKKIVCKGGRAIKCIEILKPVEITEPPAVKPTPVVETEKKVSEEGGETSGPENPPVKVTTGDTNKPVVPPCNEGHGRSCCDDCSGSRLCCHGQPPWLQCDPNNYYYYYGNCGPKPACDPYSVVRYECPQENYGPCSIM